MEWSDFKVLLSLSRAGSLAGAARDLKVDNSTVSRRLSALEEALGAKLLIRGGREFSWTPEGQSALSAAAAMEGAAEAAVRHVRASKVELEGTVRVSVAPAFIQVLTRLMKPALREQYPQLNIELSGAYHRADLARGEADVAVRMARPDEPDLVARRAFACAWFVYASRPYLAAHGYPQGLDVLCEHELVLYDESLHKNPPMRWLEPYRGAARVSRMDALETACLAALAGAGITLLPAFIADPVSELARVFPEVALSNDGFIVYHDSMRDCSRVRLVADALFDFFRSHAALFTGEASDPQ